MIGDQKDITESHLNFLARVEEGLVQQPKYSHLRSLSQFHSSRGNSIKVLENVEEKILDYDDDDYNILSSVKIIKRQSKTIEDSLIAPLFFSSAKEEISFKEEGQLVNKEVF